MARKFHDGPTTRAGLYDGGRGYRHGIQQVEGRFMHIDDAAVWISGVLD